MAKNNGNGARTGLIAGRRQFYNPKTKKYIKQDIETGKILGCKDEPWKGIRMMKKKD